MTRDEVFDDANGELAIGELESAVAKYRLCVEMDPTFFDGWHALGMALMGLVAYSTMRSTVSRIDTSVRGAAAPDFEVAVRSRISTLANKIGRQEPHLRSRR